MKKQNYRHGDVVINKRDSLPKGLSKHKNLTVAEGEVTGHHHTVISGIANQYRGANSIWIEVLSDSAEIDHQEHGRGILAKGIYEIDIQQGWEEDGWVNVID